jgi:peroxiredoxin
VLCGLAPEFRGARVRQTKNLLRAVALAAVLSLSAQPLVHAGQLAPVDRPIKPDFSLRDLDGKRVSLDGFRGRTLIVHFFATWCEPCRTELPALGRFLARSADRASVLAISVAEPDQRVKRFFGQTPASFPVLLDPDRHVAKSWNVDTLPTTYVLDADMKPALMIETEFAWDMIDAEQIDALLLKPNRTTEAPFVETAPLETGDK